MAVSLAVIVAFLAVSVIASLLIPAVEDAQEHAAQPGHAQGDQAAKPERAPAGAAEPADDGQPAP